MFVTSAARVLDVHQFLEAPLQTVMKWGIVVIFNRRVGFVHRTDLKALPQEDENELKSGPNIDAMMDVVREKMPEMMLLFDSMMDEAMKIREALEG